MAQITLHGGLPRVSWYMPWNSHSVTLSFGNDEVTFYSGADELETLRLVMAMGWTDGFVLSPAQDGEVLRGEDASAWCKRRLAELTTPAPVLVMASEGES